MESDALGRNDASGRHVDPAGNLFFREHLRPESVFDRDGHGAGCFAAADNGDAAHVLQVDYLIINCEALAIAMDMFGHDVSGQNRFDASPPDSLGVGT
jgi:hypothetical protein